MADRTNFPLVLALWGAGLGAAGQYAKISVIFDQLPGVYPDAGAALDLFTNDIGVPNDLFHDNAPKMTGPDTRFQQTVRYHRIRTRTNEPHTL